ncbi:MAG: YihY/virulence factor BrkB family protein, partial [Ardenticatenaceae bacterium]
MALSLNVSVSDLAKKTWQEFGEDSVARLGAALAYYTFASFFPLLLVLISLVGIALSFNIGGAEEARATVLDAVSANLPQAQDILAQSFQETEQNSGTLGLVGLLTGLWAASNIFSQLEESFNLIYDVAPRNRSFLEKLKARGQAALIVILIAVLMLGSLIFSTVLTTAQSFVQALPGGGVWAWLLNLLLSLTLTAVIFAALFKYIPDKPVTWKAAIIGGIFTSIAWQIGRELLTWWLGRASASVTA